MKIVITLVLLLVLGTGCRSMSTKALLPSESETQLTLFQSYDSALTAFSQVVPNNTTINQLNEFGFDIHGRNVKVMTYVDVLDMFLSSPAIRKEDLPKGILDCLEAKGGCHAYKVTFDVREKERYGNLAADFLGFKRKTKKTGWTFEALFVIVDDVVVFALHSGTQDIEIHEVKREPLGPLNNLGLNGAKGLL